jgi:hypothetical protein
MGVVFAMDRHPLARHGPGRQPQPEAEEMTHAGIQVYRTVRLVSVQEYRRCGDRDVRQHERNGNVPPG